jgi:hypothetical protein
MMAENFLANQRSIRPGVLRYVPVDQPPLRNTDDVQCLLAYWFEHPK